MPSTNKTPRLGLCDWLGSDTPLREDFCADNRLLDSAIGALRDTPLVGSYTGDGADTRVIALGFKPRLGIVFRTGDEPLIEYDADLCYTACALGLFTGDAGSLGIYPRENGFAVDYAEGNAAVPTLPCFNRSGSSYTYVVWR